MQREYVEKKAQKSTDVGHDMARLGYDALSNMS